MTLLQAELLFKLISWGSAMVDTALKLKFAVDKIGAMTDEECQKYIEDQNLLSDNLMKELDTI